MNYHNITKDDMLNGEGLRVVLWVSGCGHNCKGCHNPETHDINSGVKFDDSTKIELIEKLLEPHIQGLTISGGDPLHIQNRSEVSNICKLVKELMPNKDIWIYTGYTYEEVSDLDLLKYVDVLVDGKFVEELADIKYNYAGSTNQRIIRL